MENWREVAEVVTVRNLLLKNSQNSQENVCARLSFLIKLQAVSKMV